MKFSLSFFNYFYNLSLKKRRIILLCIDISIFIGVFYLVIWFLQIKIPISLLINFIIILTSGIFFHLFKFYRGIARYTNSSGFYIMGLKNIILIPTIAIILILLNVQLPLGFWVLQWFLFSFVLITSRLFIRDFLIFSRNILNNQDVKVLIYGAGNVGVELSNYLLKRGNYKIQCFLDDNPELWGREINRLKIKSFKDINYNDIDQILLAFNSKNSSIGLETIEKIKAKRPDIRILKVPSIEKLISGEEKFGSLEPVRIEDLLFRNIVPPKLELFGPGIRDNVVLVTGAGGSIGKELSLQILKLKPKKLLLLDFSEINIFNLVETINELNQDVDYQFLLGDCCDFNFLENIFAKHLPDTIFHAAAYKHVGILETNKIEGIKNNIFSTNNLCKLSRKYLSKKFILISSDKAVRPSSLMGLTKRISELIVSAYAMKSLEQSGEKKPAIFTMVRFGNVMGSSGSVIPIFQNQISKGGPITITHPEVSRYFMTIEEAACLVIQASVLSKGKGEVFLLDMGKPLKIEKLATKMLLLKGLMVKNAKNQKGDIEIVYKGLGPGEKLHEELLIDAKSKKTIHPLIFEAVEDSYEFEYLEERIQKINEFIKNNKYDDLGLILKELVPYYMKN